MSSLFSDLQWRGLVQQVTDPAVEDLLNAGGLTAYIGFDPTADSLHVGSLLQLLNLRRLQQAGHRPIVLAGGATGMIGDPSFKSAERQLLDDETLQHNIDGILVQLKQFLDFTEGPKQAILVNNADWIKSTNVVDFLRDIGKHFTVNTLIGRESVRVRLEDREQGISFTEFSYALLQAWDYQHLFKEYGCTLQMGASDQWGNIVSGVDLIRRSYGEKTYGLCCPLVTKSDGTKFGKTETGTVWLSAERTSPYAFYQFFVRTDDADVSKYLRFFSFRSREEIEELESSLVTEPHKRLGQYALADELTRLVHGDEETDKAIKASQALFTEDIAQLDEKLLLEVFADAPSISLSLGELEQTTLVDVLVKSGLSPSNTAARTAIQQGGVSVNNRRIENVEAHVERTQLLHDSYVVVRRGKREFAIARFE